MISFAPSTSVGYSSGRRRKKASNSGVAVLVGIAVVILGGTIGIVTYVSHHNDEVLAQNQAAEKKAAEEKAAAEKARLDALKKNDNPVFAGLPGDSEPAHKNPRPNVARPVTPTPRTPAVSNPTNPPATPSATIRPDTSSTPPTVHTPKTPGAEEGMDPIKKPATPAPGGTEEGMDPIKKPAKTPGGTEEGMDPIKKPAAGGTEEGMDPIKKPGTPTAPPTPAAPPKKDPENLDPVAAASWDAMKELAELGGKESFAVLRFEDYKRMNPGVHDAEIDQFIDKKMDRIWWERVALLIKKIDRLDVDMKKIASDLPDVQDPDVKKKMLADHKKMTSDKESAVKELRDRMKYDGNEVPDLTSESSLSSLVAQRNKNAYEIWKKGTINFIKANQGRLPWTNDF